MVIDLFLKTILSAQMKISLWDSIFAGLQLHTLVDKKKKKKKDWVIVFATF